MVHLPGQGRPVRAQERPAQVRRALERRALERLALERRVLERLVQERLVQERRAQEALAPEKPVLEKLVRGNRALGERLVQVPVRVRDRALAERLVQAPVQVRDLALGERQVLEGPVQVKAGQALVRERDRDLAQDAQEAAHLRPAYRVLEGAAPLLEGVAPLLEGAAPLLVVKVVKVLTTSLLSLAGWTLLQSSILDVIFTCVSVLYMDLLQFSHAVYESHLEFETFRSGLPRG